MNLNNHIQQILTRHGGIRLAILFASLAGETLIYSSHRRKPVSSWLISLDFGFRRNDESGINQLLPGSFIRGAGSDGLEESVNRNPAPSAAVGAGLPAIFRTVAKQGCIAAN